MTLWKLPTSLNIGGVDFFIRTDFRDVLRILSAFNDPELEDWMKIQIMLVILYPDWKKIDEDNVLEAIEKGKEFIDYGQERAPGIKTMDWDKDARLIVSEINKISHGQDIRTIDYMHWWTFLGYYMGISDGLFLQVVNIRTKKMQGKKLEKWESEFYSKNRDLIDFAPVISDEEKKKRKEEQKAVDALFY